MVRSPSKRAPRYVLGDQLGKGGFGTVFECTSKAEPQRLLAIKFTLNHRSWAHELYFDSLVTATKYGLKLEDSFALHDSSVRGGVLFCTVMERASFDLGYALRHARIPFTESKALTAALQILEPLIPMHNAGVVHRDVTPWNVFVMADGSMRLADFGIAAQATERRLVSASTNNPGWVPPGLNTTGKWTPSLDCWQVGQLIAAMLTGTTRPIAQSDIRVLPCSDVVKEIIWRAIGTGAQRFGNADDLRKALRARTPVRESVAKGRPSSLAGLKVCFTGKLDACDRQTAERLGRRAGAHVVKNVTFDTDLLVLGAPSPAYTAGSSGNKLLEAQRFNAQGASIRTVTEAHFLRLVPSLRRSK